MAKVKTIFVCQNCGAIAPKWTGRCSSCGEWNTMTEEVEVQTKQKSPMSGSPGILSKPLTLDQIETGKMVRCHTGNHELDRVLGGGLVPGSIILLGGEPGIGKSTLVLQVALSLRNKKVLYISGEESLEQIKLRAVRLKQTENTCYFASETTLENILQHLEVSQPELLIVDSIQTVSAGHIESSAGSIVQIRECTSAIMQKAKSLAVPVILIGHINKEGSIAGPKVLEHVVDTVLQFEGDHNHMYRILRASKNRFGSTSEMGIYEMRSDGLREVSNPSELLLSNEHLGLSGTSVAAAIEGIRPFLIEVQALVSSAAYGNPQRSATGFDLRRLNMLLAVLEKRAGFKLVTKDVFLNIAGGIKVYDTATDLAVMASVLSSNFDKALNPGICLSGEVGLTGEVRPIHRIEQRIAEAAKLGFQKILIPKANKGYELKNSSIQVIPVRTVTETLKILFG